MRMYLAALILNFVEDEFVSTIGLFKYSMIGLLKSGASIAIIVSSFAVLGWFKSSTKISTVVFGLEGSSRDNSSALTFFSLGIYSVCTFEKFPYCFLISSLLFK